MPKRLAIVGAGPKGAAVAAKAAAMRACGIDAPDVVLFERDGIAAAWDGNHGYTDGEASLCTPAAHDLGFPYDHLSFGQDVKMQTFRTSSWPTYLALRSDAYRDHVARGQRSPTHRVFADYVAHVVDASGATVIRGEVVRIGRDATSGKWRVSLAERVEDGFDGVMITGSGPPIRPLPGADRDVLNGYDLWSGVDAVRRRLLTDPKPSVVVIGSRGTAGAAAAWLVGQGRSFPVRMIGRQPTVAVRTPSSFDMRLFGNDAEWRQLSVKQRRSFLDRVSAGFVWASVSAVLEACPDFAYLAGDAKSFVRERKGVELIVRAGRKRLQVPATLFIDCRGFDSWWFIDLLADPEFDAWKSTVKSKRNPVGRSLALTSPFPYPGLHVPALGANVGPGANNLLALGWLSDRVLKDYI